MLKMSFTEQRVSRTRNVVAGVTAIEEGSALMAVRVGGELQVQVSTGGANTDEFAGFALSERTAPALFPQIVVAPVVLLATGVYGVQLSRPIVGTPRVSYTSNNAALTSGDTNAGDYLLAAANTRVTVNAADLGKSITIAFKYAPTVQDMMLLGGDNSPTTFTTMVGALGATSVIESGVVYTSLYDITIDWASWTPAIGLKAVANGVVTTAAGTGATIKGRVIQAPTVDYPYLGLDFQAHS